jgi:quercetin dioxygenase-like cupin family protein
MTTSAADGNMTDDFAHFDLKREIADSEQKKPWQAGHHAKTLYKRADFRAVLITMEPSAKIKEHHADGTISVQVLKGRIRFNTQGKAQELGIGELFTLASSIPHSVESLDDSAFLLTISWPRSQELAAMGHRGYGS